MRGNALVDLRQPYLMHYGNGWGPTRLPENFRNCLVDFNHVRIRSGVPLMEDAGPKVRTLEEIRKEYGWEFHGDIGTYDEARNDLTPETLGGSAVTFRVPWGEKSHLARPMLSDAKINGKWPAAAEVGPGGISTPLFFWRFSDGDYNERAFADWGDWPWYCNDVAWEPFGGGLGPADKDDHLGCRWYVGADENFGKNPDGRPVKVEGPGCVAELSLGKRWLVLQGVAPERIPPQGLGYWTPWLATVEGAKMTVTLKMRGKDIVPTAKPANHSSELMAGKGARPFICSSSTRPARTAGEPTSSAANRHPVGRTARPSPGPS